MDRRSSNDRPPWLAPQRPLYPPLRQLVRTRQRDGPVWSANVEQHDGNLALRDREPCYLWEPNAVPLNPGVAYRSRLVGVYTGTAGQLPLYVVGFLCCAGTTSPSLSSSEFSIPSQEGSSSESTSESPSPSPVSFSESPSLSESASPSESESGSPELPSFPSEGQSSSEFPLPEESASPSESESASPQLPSEGPSVSGSESGGPGVFVPCCPNAISANLVATLHVTNFDPFSGCACLDGVEVGLTFTAIPGGGGEWRGHTFVNCFVGTQDLEISLTCTHVGGQDVWTFEASCDPDAGPNWIPLAQGCDPFFQEYEIEPDQAMNGCCGVGSGLTITIMAA